MKRLVSLAAAVCLPTACFDGDGGPSSEPPRLAGITHLHNQLRAQVGTLDLIWWSDLAASAQAYADKCVYKHSGYPNLGENLAAFAPSNRPPSAAVDIWASEKAHYNHATNTCAAGQQCGHFTQMVWRNTKYLGCGVAICPINSPLGVRPWELWVCHYSPPGNYVGQRPY